MKLQWRLDKLLLSDRLGTVIENDRENCEAANCNASIVHFKCYIRDLDRVTQVGLHGVYSSGIVIENGKEVYNATNYSTPTIHLLSLVQHQNKVTH